MTPATSSDRRRSQRRGRVRDGLGHVSQLTVRAIDGSQPICLPLPRHSLRWRPRWTAAQRWPILRQYVRRRPTQTPWLCLRSATVSPSLGTSLRLQGSAAKCERRSHTRGNPLHDVIDDRILLRFVEDLVVEAVVNVECLVDRSRILVDQPGTGRTGQRVSAAM
jgi:hypothetical protein